MDIENEKGLISECEDIAERIAEEFTAEIDGKTHNFREYRFAYRLALDMLEKRLERGAP